MSRSFWTQPDGQYQIKDRLNFSITNHEYFKVSLGNKTWTGEKGSDSKSVVVWGVAQEHDREPRIQPGRNSEAAHNEISKHRCASPKMVI